MAMSCNAPIWTWEQIHHGCRKKPKGLGIGYIMDTLLTIINVIMSFMDTLLIIIKVIVSSIDHYCKSTTIKRVQHLI